MSEATPAAILQIGTGFMASKTLLSAIEVGVFNTLAKGPADLATLQQKLGLHPRSARDFLDALVSLKLLERNNGVYSNTVETDLFLDKAKPSYVGGLLEMANARLYRFWGSLTEALKTGELQNEGKGGGDNFFAAMYATPDKLRDFLRAMTASALARRSRSRRSSSGGAMQRSWISARRRASCRSFWPRPIRIFAASASTFRWFDLCSRSSLPATGFPTGSRSRRVTSSRTTCRKPT